jgi:protein phosphatase
VLIPNPALVLLVGPSGSGKTTFAAAHFSPTEILSSDAMRAALTDDPADQDASAEAFHVLSLLVNGRMRRRLMTVVDATNLSAVSRRRFRKIADRHGVPTVAIAFDLPAAVFHARNEVRPGRVVDESVVANQADRMRQAVADLHTENYAALLVLTLPGEVASVSLERLPLR